MPTLLEILVSNTVAAVLLAVPALAAARWGRPALAHGLWLLVMVKLVTPPLIPVHVPAWHWDLRSDPVAQNQGKAAPAMASLETLSTEDIALLLKLSDEKSVTVPAPAATAAAPAEPDVAVTCQQALVWLCVSGSLLWLVWTSASVFRFHRLLHSARLAPVGLQNEARLLAGRLGLRSSPPVWIVPGAVSPMIWAVGAWARLVFPTKLLDRLDREQRASLLLHELAHVRRRDHWVRLLELAIGAVFWWHPLFWLARRELREAEEQCCDAWVVWASDGEGEAYARALLEAVAFVSHTRCPLPATASGVGPVSHLRRRLTMIMRGTTPRSLSTLGWIIVLALGLCLLPLAGRAQAALKPDDDKEEREMALERTQDNEVDKEEGDELIADLVMDEADEVQQSIAELKQEIAEKRAELNKLEAKLKATLSKLDKKAAKIDKEKMKGKDTKGEINIEFSKDLGKDLAEKIKKSIRDNPDFQKLEELKKLGKLEGLNKLEELKKLGELKPDVFKAIEDVKKHLGEMKELDAKKLEALKKERVEFERSREKLRKADDIDARLDRLMKELEELRKEVHEKKEGR